MTGIGVIVAAFIGAACTWIFQDRRSVTWLGIASMLAASWCLLMAAWDADARVSAEWLGWSLAAGLIAAVAAVRTRRLRAEEAGAVLPETRDEREELADDELE